MMRRVDLFILLILNWGCINGYSQNWEQTSKTLPPLYPHNLDNQYFGNSVSIDGDYAVVGAYGYENYTGIAYILHFNGSNWIVQAKLTASDRLAGDCFGFSVSISGDHVVVGANNDAVNGITSVGSVYVFSRPGSGWTDMTETAHLRSSDGASGNNFGSSVCISGDNIVVGAQGNSNNGVQTGSAYVFTRPLSGWVDTTQTAKIRSSNGLGSDCFGSSVAISGDVIVTGAYGNDTYGNNAGSAYIFCKPISGWTDMFQTATLSASDIVANDGFGTQVSISGETVVVTVPAKNSCSGAAYVFTKPVNGWADTIQTAKILASDAATNDYFGYSAGISDTTIVIGAYRENENGYHAGSAYVFSRPPQGWVNMTQTAKIKASDGYTSDYFGVSVGISGVNVIVGAHYDDDYGSNSGSVYIYTKPANGWINMNQTQKLSGIYYGNYNEYYGQSVAIDGNIAVVGAYKYENLKGAAFLYAYDYCNGWLPIAKLTASDRFYNDRFGCAVSISGDNIVIGAMGESTNSGAAYVFSKPVTGWHNMTETAKIRASDNSGSDYFGYSVCISGDNIVVGSPNNDNIHGNEAGAAYVFTKPLTGWVSATQTAKLIASDGYISDFLGMSVGISGDYAVAGSYGDDDHGGNTGSAYIFTKAPNGWTDTTQIAKLLASNGTGDDFFGISVSISGDDVAVGSYQTDNNTANSGAVYVFSKPTLGWSNMTQTAKLTAGDGGNGDRLGYSVNISNNSVIAGSYNDDDNGSNSGSAYIFIKPVNGWANSIHTAKIKPADGASEDYFGNSVGISGNNAVVGALQDDDHGAQSGSAYFFSAGSPVSVLYSGDSLYTDITGSYYQWLDCDNGFAAIPGANNQSFSPGNSGNYAVAVTHNTCTDTSVCANFIVVGSSESDFSDIVQIFPNPTTGLVNIHFPIEGLSNKITVRDITGRKIRVQNFYNTQETSFSLEGNPGLYFVEINNEKGTYKYKVVKLEE